MMLIPNLIKIHPSVRLTLLEETERCDDTVRCVLLYQTKKVDYKKEGNIRMNMVQISYSANNYCYAHKTHDAHHTQKKKDGKKGQNKQPYINQGKLTENSFEAAVLDPTAAVEQHEGGQRLDEASRNKRPI